MSTKAVSEVQCIWQLEKERKHGLTVVPVWYLIVYYI